MNSDEVVKSMLDKGIIQELVEEEDWGEVAKYLRELRRDLGRGFERLKDCLSCPPNAMFCSEVRRLAESYERSLLATLMLKCFLNDALRVVEDERTRRRLNEVLKITDDLITLLNEKHNLVHQLIDKCKPIWGDRYGL
jgi:hypothetical protein